jgi:hypothetical protein
MVEALYGPEYLSLIDENVESAPGDTRIIPQSWL